MRDGKIGTRGDAFGRSLEPSRKDRQTAVRANCRRKTATGSATRSAQSRTASARIPVGAGQNQTRTPTAQVPKIFPKYQNPKAPFETWAGRGKQPRWLVSALKAGGKIEDFEIAVAVRGRGRAKVAGQSRRH